MSNRFNRRACLPLLFAILLGSLHSAVSSGAGLSTIRLTTTRGVLLADGQHSAIVRADVLDSSGRPINGLLVEFHTDSGTLSQSEATTIGGIAQVTLTSATIAGTAHITATVPGSSVAETDIIFTDDPEATFEGNNYLSLSSSGYLAYSGSDRIMEGNGKNGGARLDFKNFEIRADRIQVKCQDLIVRAHDNITMKHGKAVIHATRLYYSLQTHQGFAIAVDLKGVLSTVTVNGENLRLDPSPHQIPYSYMTFIDLNVHLIIVAKSITYFPGDKLQFRRPVFFQDQAPIMKLPYYELPLKSDQLFSDQFISVGTSGLGLDLPLYLGLSPHAESVVYIMHQEPLGRGYFATEPGWSINLVKGYNQTGDQRYDGSFSLTGLTRSDWGAEWIHNLEFNPYMQGSFDIAFPHHESVLASTSITEQNKLFHWAANLSEDETLTGESTNTTRLDLSAESTPHSLEGTHTFLYTLGATFGAGKSISDDPLVANLPDRTEQVTVRAFTRPIILSPQTTLSDSFTLGRVWADNNASGVMALASLGIIRSFNRGGTLNVSYDFTDQPNGLTLSNGRDRISASYIMSGLKQRFQASIITSTYLDVPDSSVLADLSYRINSQWRILGSATMENYQGASYQDVEFTIGRKLGARELQLTYSTFYNRVSFDMMATKF